MPCPCFRFVEAGERDGAAVGIGRSTEGMTKGVAFTGDSFVGIESPQVSRLELRQG